MMGSIAKRFGILFVAGLIWTLLISFPATAIGQVYPDKPITVYCGFAPGATTDLTTRALAAGAEKLLGVPVIVENKPGGGSTVAPALLVSKKPDGYTIALVTSAALLVYPHRLKLGYDPMKDFTYLVHFSRYIGGLCVNSDSPLKTIDEFIAYAKKNPGLSYTSSGVYAAQHLAVQLLAKCKGLTFKHIPTKGGAEINTMLLGKHTDFVAGSGSHIPYVQQGLFRMLLVYNQDERDPNYPDIPTIKELGCQDIPPSYYLVIGPKGMPAAISKKLVETFKKVTEGPDFQKLLANNNLPYDFRDQAQLEEMMPARYEWYKNYFKETGAIK
jgi:tripartite-type tricarboxylate transporter receptor subunit TctC